MEENTSSGFKNTNISHSNPWIHTFHSALIRQYLRLQLDPAFISRINLSEQSQQSNLFAIKRKGC